MHHQHRHDHRQKRNRIDGIRTGDPHRRDDDASRRWADHLRHVRHQHTHRRRRRQLGPWHKQRHQRLPGRIRDPFEHRRNHRHEIDQPNSDMSGSAHDRQKQRQRKQRRLGPDQRPAAISPVSDHAANQSKDQDRDKAKKAQQPEHERIVRQLIDLPGDSHALDLRSSLGKRFRAPEKSKIPKSENAVRSAGNGLAHADSAKNRCICPPVVIVAAPLEPEKGFIVVKGRR